MSAMADSFMGIFGYERVDMSNAGKRHMGRVSDWAKDAGCVVCGEPFAHLHHILEDRTPGRKSPDFLTIPLCLECHVGVHGIHGTRQRFSMHKTSETKALAETLEAVYGNNS